jgi:hypothetical protein
MTVHDTTAPTAALDTFGAAVDAARTALTQPPYRALDAVGWLSAHLASEERVLRHFAGRGRRRTLRPVAHTLQEELRWLEQVHSGDALVTGRDAEHQRYRVLEALDTYASVERQVLMSVLDRADEDARRELASAYRRSMQIAPTRPHPHLPTRGLAGAVMFRLQGWWDAAMNTMDARHVPIPRRERTVAEAGKWTGYLLGGVPPSAGRSADRSHRSSSAAR